MGRYLRKAAASNYVRIAAVLTVLLLAGQAAIWHTAENDLTDRPTVEMEAVGAEGARSDLRTRLSVPRAGRTPVAEVDLKELLVEIGPDGGVVLDREALDRTLHDVAGIRGPIGSVSVADALSTMPPTQVTFEGVSVDIDRRTAMYLLRFIFGPDVSLEDLTVEDLLAALEKLQLNSDLDSGSLGLPGMATMLRQVTGSGESIELVRDDRFVDRQTILRRYTAVETVVEQVTQEGLAEDRPAVYDEAFARLVADGMEEAIPLLEGRQRLEQYLESPELHTMDAAERVAYRQQARRLAFGDETAELLFDRRESMERYREDLLAIRADASLSDELKAEQIRRRRLELKVELAGRGSYVGFADEARTEAERLLREELGDTLDEMSAAEKDEMLRQHFLRQLPPEMRDHVASVKGGGRR